MDEQRAILRDVVRDLLACLDHVAPAERARCAESVACDLAGTVSRHELGGWPAAVDLIGTAPSASRCGLLTAAAMITGGPMRTVLSRRAATMRRRLPANDWLDHIGAAEPTGRAARGERPGHLMWLIELDDGLHRYCLMTEQDLDPRILRWAGLYPPFDTPVPADIAGDLPRLVDVSLGIAIAGMTESLTVPGMLGVSTTVPAFGLFVRRRLWQLDPPSPRELDQLDWQPDVVHPSGPVRDRSRLLRLVEDGPRLQP